MSELDQVHVQNVHAAYMAAYQPNAKPKHHNGIYLTKLRHQ
jgi:hypothetical protein